jgi:hypothetical protein
MLDPKSPLPPLFQRGEFLPFVKGRRRDFVFGAYAIMA